MQIEVFLPPNQRCDGTLELYNMQYNIAIVSIKNRFNAIRPADILCKEMEVSPEKVVAIGRDTIHGLLMGTTGQVKSNNKDCKLNCKELQCSTCNITKAGIGGPLIGFDGSFVGMNFYDGSDVTPFLPRLVIFNLLRGVVNSRIPSESGEYPMRILDDFMVGEKYRWPVPEPYWYHGELDVDMDELPKFIGRILN
nr:unnamed protein product [Digitaria exilis]